MKWFRVWHGSATDPKWRTVSRRSGQSVAVVYAVWTFMLETASNKGVLPDEFDGMAQSALNVPAADCAAIRAAMSGLTLDGKTIIAWHRFRGNLRPNADEWGRLRSQVFARDDYTCVYCGTRGTRLECDHVVPVSRGGENEIENLATACFSCNRKKRAKLVSEWRQ